MTAQPHGPWLYGIARRVVAGHHRSTATALRAVGRIDTRELVDDDASDRIIARIDGQRAARAVYRSLAALPERQRAVVELVAVDQLTLTEAALALGISAGNAPGALPPRTTPTRPRGLPAASRPARGDDMNAPLDSFESALLSRLREHVEEQPAEQPRSSRRRLLVGAIVTSAAAVMVVVVPGLGSTTAYSVQEGNSGTITVEVERLEDAGGLEAALAEHGVHADITYLPDRQECAPGRYTPVGRSLSGMQVSMGTDRLVVTLRARHGARRRDVRDGRVRGGRSSVLGARARRRPRPGWSSAAGPTSTSPPAPRGRPARWCRGVESADAQADARRATGPSVANEPFSAYAGQPRRDA